MSPGLPLRISPRHPALAGHFPGNPIVPGVVLLDEAIHALAVQAGLATAGLQLGAVKFLAPVRLPAAGPDAELALTWSGSIAPGGNLRFELTAADGTKIASATLTWPATADASP
jgi:3-hydroxymyristoyl/3-hydroxydecanoyl-(acyl carrier protein) dehydratase